MSRTNSRHLVSLAVAAALAAAAMNAQAQSTATQIEEGEIVELEEVTVTAQRIRIAGLIHEEDATKSKSTVAQEYLSTQLAGQSVVQSLNLVPGVNFTNNDPYGASGGNIRMRSFDGNRISLMVDGIQLNDSGNYAIYTNQQLDPEVLERATVNLGTTDVDSPTASATGGTINLSMARPKKTPAVQLRTTLGKYDFGRVFARVDSGEFGPWDTSSYLTYSYQAYDKFKGPGELRRAQLNGRVYQALPGDHNFMSLAIHGNRNRNNSYNSVSLAQFRAENYTADNDDPCPRSTPGAGVQNESVAPFSTCTNYYGTRINPSDTGNIRGQLSLGLAENLRFTLDPSFQYVLANGGGYTTLFENDARLRGSNQAAPGTDLNGDGDYLDRIATYNPSNTNTHRYSANAGLLWTITATDLIRLSYTYDRARHRQTGEFGYYDSEGNPESPFSGRNARPVLTADGNVLQKRDRLSIAMLNQASLSYSGRYMDERLRLNLGVRAPFFQRDLDQHCYSSVGNPGGDPTCTAQTALTPTNATAAGRGYVVFGSAASTTYFLRPYERTYKYDKLLPNIGVSYELLEDHTVYASYTKGFSAPRTDNLYGSLVELGVQPETTNTFELGYRYQSGPILSSLALWKTDFSNRIISSYDELQGISVDRNVGEVKLWGIDGAIGFEPVQGLTAYVTASYNNSEVQNDIPGTTVGSVLATGGKEVVETPDVTYGARVQYEIAGFQAGIQAKYTGHRWATDVNDVMTPSYKLVDADLRYTFQFAGLDSFLQFNVLNLFDEKYYSSISTQTAQTSSGGPRFYVGSPRTYQVTFEIAFGGK